jgi:EF hand
MGTSLEEAFKHFDSDNSGTISAQELLQGLKGLGQFHDIITLQDAQRFVQGFTSAVSVGTSSSSDTTKRGATTGMSKQAFFEFVRYVLNSVFVIYMLLTSSDWYRHAVAYSLPILLCLT